MEILGRSPSGLKLDQITVKAINAGCKIKTNVIQAVYYHALVPLIKQNKVEKNDETKKYTLIKEEVSYAEVGK